MIISGKIWMFGDDVDTDLIIPARYLSVIEPEKLAEHCLEGICPRFSREVTPGDIIVAGKNFGCGSSREHAPLAIKGAGVSCVIARSFARIFYRNAINTGLPILECLENLTGLLTPGEELTVDLERGLITDRRRCSYQAAPFSPFMQEIITDGGLIAYVRKRLNLPRP